MSKVEDFRLNALKSGAAVAKGNVAMNASVALMILSGAERSVAGDTLAAAMEVAGTLTKPLGQHTGRGGCKSYQNALTACVALADKLAADGFALVDDHSADEDIAAMVAFINAALPYTGNRAFAPWSHIATYATRPATASATMVPENGNGTEAGAKLAKDEPNKAFNAAIGAVNKLTDTERARLIAAMLPTLNTGALASLVENGTLNTLAEQVLAALSPAPAQSGTGEPLRLVA